MKTSSDHFKTAFQTNSMSIINLLRHSATYWKLHSAALFSFVIPVATDLLCTGKVRGLALMTGLMMWLFVFESYEDFDGNIKGMRIAVASACLSSAVSVLLSIAVVPESICAFMLFCISVAPVVCFCGFRFRDMDGALPLLPARADVFMRGIGGFRRLAYVFVTASCMIATGFQGIIGWALRGILAVSALVLAGRRMLGGITQEEPPPEVDMTSPALSRMPVLREPVVRYGTAGTRPRRTTELLLAPRTPLRLPLGQRHNQLTGHLRKSLPLSPIIAVPQVLLVVPDGLRGRTQMTEQDIIGRVERYMAEKETYLDPMFGIDMMARDIGTNRGTLSKVINEKYGMNFSRFVNSRRVSYALGVFRSNPDVKVSDLTTICGFRNMVSFIRAFRFEMDMTPGEWCREERERVMLARSKGWVLSHPPQPSSQDAGK